MPNQKIAGSMLFPEGIKCIFCDGELSISSDYSICENCFLEYNNEFCNVCGRSIGNMASYCDYCQKTTWSFKAARSSFCFTDRIKDAIYSFKFGGEKYIGRYLAKFMLDTLNKFFGSDCFDIITFVPIHKKKLKKRGFNQSKILAEKISEFINKPVYEMLIKNADSKSLAIFNAEERRKIIKDSFSINKEIVLDKPDISEIYNGDMPHIVDKIDINKRNILLIDDVFTTGATVQECSKVLKKAKCGDIYVLTFASVPFNPLLKNNKRK